MNFYESDKHILSHNYFHQLNFAERILSKEKHMKCLHWQKKWDIWTVGFVLHTPINPPLCICILATILEV